MENILIGIIGGILSYLLLSNSNKEKDKEKSDIIENIKLEIKI